MAQTVATTATKTAKNLSEKIIENLKNYSKIIYYTIAIFVLIMICFFMSENYRINKVLRQMDVYRQYITIDSKLNSRDMREKKLCDFYVASSFRSCLGLSQRFDYVNVEVLASVIESGARLVWLDVFNDNMSPDAMPVVSNGLDQGNWRYTLNSVKLEDALQKIATTAFNPGRVNNYNDPFFIALNLNVQNNLKTLNKIKRLIIKHLKNKLLPSRYGFLSKNISQVEIKELLGKVIIFTSGGYESSELEELINYSWDKPDMRVISHKSIDSTDKSFDIVKLDKSEVKNFNSTNLTLVLPDENTMATNNYDPVNAFDTGCQFACMNYQKPDSSMDSYITKFRESSFILRPKKFSGQSYGSKLKLSRTQQDIKDDSGKSCQRCPMTQEDTPNPVALFMDDSDKGDVNEGDSVEVDSNKACPYKVA